MRTFLYIAAAYLGIGAFLVFILPKIKDPNATFSSSDLRIGIVGILLWPLYLLQKARPRSQSIAAPAPHTTTTPVAGYGITFGEMDPTKVDLSRPHGQEALRISNLPS